MFDPNQHKVLDVLPDRRLETIDNYLYRIDYREKERVKYFISDMNEAYRTVKNRHFPQATHIIDTFHFCRYVEDAWNNVRIRIHLTKIKRNIKFLNDIGEFYLHILSI